MSENAERLARETNIVRTYGAYTVCYAVVSSLALVMFVLFKPQALNWLTATLFLLSIVFAVMYQYFSLRFLVNLGTRYDLMPIVKRSLLLQGWSNRPIYYYVFSLVTFLLGWLSLIWNAL